MSTAKIKYAISGFVGTILIGIFMLGLPFAAYVAWGAWNEEFPFKLNGGWKWVWEQTWPALYSGAFLGAVCGTVAGIGLLVFRLLKKFPAT
jgi:hypothetical protein